MTSRGKGALPEKHPLMEVRSARSIPGWFSIPMNMVGTSGAKVGLNLLMASRSGSGWGLGNQHVPPAGIYGEIHGRGEAEHMKKRQGPQT